VVIPLNNDRNDGLWNGGQWEQPSPAFTPPPPVHIPASDFRRPVLRAKPRGRRWPWVVGGLLLTAALIGGAIYLGNWLDENVDISFHGSFDPPGSHEDWTPSWNTPEAFRSDDPPTIPQAPTGTGVTVELHPPTGEVLDYTRIYDTVAPSLVSIESTTANGYSTGTGVILTADGYIITNAHVVAGGLEVRVILFDNRVLSAKLVGFHSTEDLAVLKVEGDDLLPAQFGDSARLRIGESVAAIGDSLGYRSTITDGIVSSLDREVDVEGTTMVLIQTSAAINFGNSGGALVNRHGQVVGITTVKIVADDGSAEGLGFAIPSQRMKYVVDALIDGRAIRPGVFGFTVYTLPSEGGGLEVLEVDEASDAWAKGIRAGDILMEADGQPITGTEVLSRAKQNREAGDSVSITYLRDGVSHTVDVVLVDADLIS